MGFQRLAQPPEPAPVPAEPPGPRASGPLPEPEKPVTVPGCRDPVSDRPVHRNPRWPPGFPPWRAPSVFYYLRGIFYPFWRRKPCTSLGFSEFVSSGILDRGPYVMGVTDGSSNHPTNPDSQ